MEIIGRVTKDATVTKLKDERQVVNFSIVMKPKGTEEAVNITTYVNCDYWINPKIAGKLTKGKIVELSGRIGVNAYNNQQGEAKASLTFHVNNLKLYGSANSKDDVTANDKVAIEETADDLPF